MEIIIFHRALNMRSCRWSSQKWKVIIIDRRLFNSIFL